MFLCILHVALQTWGTAIRRPPLCEQGFQCLPRHLYREGRPAIGAQQTGTCREQKTVCIFQIIVIIAYYCTSIELCREAFCWSKQTQAKTQYVANWRATSSFLTSLAPPSLPQKKEKSESERLLTEQLQAKEWELLKLRTEMETSQGTGSARSLYFITLCQYLSLSVRPIAVAPQLQLEWICMSQSFILGCPWSCFLTQTCL